MFGVWGLGFGVLGFGVWGVGVFRGLGLKPFGLEGYSVQGLGPMTLEFGVLGRSGFEGLGCVRGWGSLAPNIEGWPHKGDCLSVCGQGCAAAERTQHKGPRWYQVH